MQSNQSQRTSGTIAVGVDDSPSGNHALNWAAAEASRRGSRLLALHAWDTPTPISGVAAPVAPVDPELYEHDAKSVLNAALDQAAPAQLRTAIEPSVQRGYPARVLLDALDQADLLVLGSRGRGGFTGLPLGSVSQKCAEHATRPVVVVPRNSRLPDSADVVVGVDGSPGSHRALRWAIDEAAGRKARLAIVNTWWTPYVVPPIGVAVAHADPEVSIEQSNRLLHQMADRALSEATEQPADVEFLPIGTSASKGLLDRSQGAGLLVVGSRGGGGFPGLLLGSVSQQCLRHAPGAIVVVPQPRRAQSK